MSERWVRDEAVLWRRSADTVVLLPPGADQIVTLSSTGQALWAELAVPRTLEQVAGRLAETYGVPAATVTEDLRRVLRDLEERALVVRLAA